MLARFVAWLIVAASGLGCVAAWAGGVELAPHRASYSLSLASVVPGSGVVGARGTMDYAFTDACDGWTTENRIAMTYTYSEGGEAATTTDFITWESKDGLKYRFRLRNTRDGQVTEEIEGAAELKGAGQGGVARYTRPEALSMPLPKGTMFPTEHTRALVRSAMGGGHVFLKVVFDGSDMQGAYDVNTLIGKLKPTPAGVSDPLLDSPSWPMRLAFFPHSKSDSVPDLEMGIDYHANGVAGSIVQGFKDFSLAGRLERLELVKGRGC